MRPAGNCLGARSAGSLSDGSVQYNICGGSNTPPTQAPTPAPTQSTGGTDEGCKIQHGYNGDVYGGENIAATIGVARPPGTTTRLTFYTAKKATPHSDGLPELPLCGLC